MGKSSDTAKIRALNDRIRTSFQGGRVVMTQDVGQLAPNIKAKLIAAVQRFQSFGKNNDPYGEHDFGAIKIEGQKFFFKIDYFDLAMSQHSVDPADPHATMRVMTNMHASEY